MAGIPVGILALDMVHVDGNTATSDCHILGQGMLDPECPKASAHRENHNAISLYHGPVGAVDGRGSLQQGLVFRTRETGEALMFALGDEIRIFVPEALHRFITAEFEKTVEKPDIVEDVNRCLKEWGLENFKVTENPDGNPTRKICSYMTEEEVHEYLQKNLMNLAEESKTDRARPVKRPEALGDMRDDSAQH